MEDFITRKEHEEFCERMKSENKRLADEDNRQNHRIEVLEDSNKQITELALSVQELAASVKSIAKETERQGERMEESIRLIGERIKKLESRDGEMWRKVTGYIVTAVIGILIGFVFKQIGM